MRRDPDPLTVKECMALWTYWVFLAIAFGVVLHVLFEVIP